VQTALFCNERDSVLIMSLQELCNSCFIVDVQISAIKIACNTGFFCIALLLQLCGLLKPDILTAAMYF